MYMGTFVVQFRADESARALLEGLGLNPNDFGRDAFERAFRMLRTDRDMQEINRMRERIKARMGNKSLFGGKSATQMLREERDSR